MRLVWPFAAVVVIAVGLYLLPGRAAIPPPIEDDNAYIYMTADRWHAGLGPTCTHPRAPLQAWEWRADWVVLTQWPLGYPFLLCIARRLLRCSTVEAGQLIAVVACAVAVVGWFGWGRRMLPNRGVAGTVLAAVSAGSSVSAAAVIEPSTDMIGVALLPLVLLLVEPAAVGGGDEGAERADRIRLARLALAGVLAGLMCWIRYAAVFVPAGVGAFLLVQWAVRRRVMFGQVASFGLAAAVPLVMLVVTNRLLSTAVPLQETFNLGQSVGFARDPRVLATIWWNFSDLPFYGYHRFAHVVYAAVIPLGVAGVVCSRRSWRSAVRSWTGGAGFGLGAGVVLALFVILAAASLFFRGKHTYIDVDRYYWPVRPLYFLLLVGPLLAVPRRTLRGLACIPLGLCLLWFVQVEWPRPYQRWLAAQRPVTDYGRWAINFEPNSRELYRWLGVQNDPRLIVFSNFHDDIALETGIPANPPPVDEQQLGRWVERIGRTRGVTDLRLLFVLDPSNHNRDYFLPPPEEIVAKFQLRPCPAVPATIAGYVYEYRPGAVLPATEQGDTATAPALTGDAEP